jgi:hypothetical protein
MNPIGPRCWPMRRQRNWPADDAWLRQAGKSHSRFPTSTDQRLLKELTIFCQVCWRTMRWHNGRTRRARNLQTGKAFPGCLTKLGRERTVFHHGLEPCAPMKAEYICADKPVTLIFRLRQSGGPYIPVCLSSASTRMETSITRITFAKPFSYPIAAIHRGSRSWNYDAQMYCSASI